MTNKEKLIEVLRIINIEKSFSLQLNEVYHVTIKVIEISISCGVYNVYVKTFGEERLNFIDNVYEEILDEFLTDSILNRLELVKKPKFKVKNL